MRKGEYKDISGMVFERLTVLNLNHIDPREGAVWNCVCSCGNNIVAKGRELRSGHVKSCGCLKNEKASQRMTKHGMSHTKLAYVWSCMKQRTSNPSNKKYPDYGGRGISVCDEWKQSFQSFYDWSMAHGYKEGLSIDRIDNDGNYTPENCRWTTAKTQSSNKRTQRPYMRNGKMVIPA